MGINEFFKDLGKMRGENDSDKGPKSHVVLQRGEREEERELMKPDSEARIEARKVAYENKPIPSDDLSTETKAANDNLTFVAENEPEETDIQ